LENTDFLEGPMRKSIFCAIFASGIALVAACDSLSLPVQGGPVGPTTDGGPSTTDDVVVAPVSSIVPAGATFGEAHKLKFADGTVYTWVMLDDAGKVKEISWTLPIVSILAVSGASVDLLDYAQLPAAAGEQTYIQALGIDYRPKGHSPSGVYDKPHFEFHVLSVPSTLMDAINCDDAPKVDPIPGKPGKGTFPGHTDLVPTALWIDTPFGCLAKMGTHGYNGLEPEYNQEVFSTSSHLTFYNDAQAVPYITSFEIKATIEVLTKRESFEFKHFDALRPAKLGKKTMFPARAFTTFNKEFDAYIYTVTDFAPIE
jgi:hypothetical protein